MTLSKANEPSRRQRRSRFELTVAAAARQTPLVADTIVDGVVVASYDFSRAPACGDLRSEVIGAFRNCAGQGGGWNSAHTTGQFGYKTVRFLDWISAHHSTVSGAGDLTPAVWHAYQLAQPKEDRAAILVIRKLLLHTTLSPDLRQVLSKPLRLARPDTTVASVLDDGLIHRLGRAAEKYLQDRLEQVEAGLSLVEQWKDANPGPPPSSPRCWGALLFHYLENLGDLPTHANGDPTMYHLKKFVYEFVDVLPPVPSTKSPLGRNRVFPTRTDAVAMGLLIAVRTGWNPEVIVELNVPRSNAAAGTDTHPIWNLTTDKRRRGPNARWDNQSLPDTGPGSAGYAVSLALRLTAALRESAVRGDASKPERLIIWRGSGPVARTGLGMKADRKETIAHLTNAWGLTEPDGSAWVPSMAGIRRSVVEMLDRHGRPAVSQHHSAEVHANDYLRRNPKQQARNAALITSGQQRALEKAADILRHGSEAAGSADQVAEATGLSMETAQKISDGTLDTPGGPACSDMLHSPFSRGGPCLASFLLCFACANAVLVKHHAPRLTVLVEAVENLRVSLPAERWQRDWLDSGHYARINDAYLAFSDSDRLAARSKINELDHRYINDLLRQTLDTA